MIQEAFRFSLVGLAATFVHLIAGVTLIDAGWMPAIANLAAFGTAFLVSFAGHFGYTFSSRRVMIHRSFQRFLVVALAGFVINETALTILLAQEATVAQTGLVISTILAALSTFILSRFWAFDDT
jgi:putative flippase GtrA